MVSVRGDSHQTEHFYLVLAWGVRTTFGKAQFANKELYNAAKRHLRLCELAGITFRPKHHLFAHLIFKCPGNDLERPTQNSFKIVGAQIQRNRAYMK